MDNFVFQYAFCIELSWTILSFGMLFVSSMYHRVSMDNFVFRLLFVSSMYHRVSMDNFVFWYAFCVFNVS